MLDEQHLPLPVSKPLRVWMEVARTFAAVSAVLINTAVLLRVFGVL
jgi:hypothetical protein